MGFLSGLMCGLSRVYKRFMRACVGLMLGLCRVSLRLVKGPRNPEPHKVSFKGVGFKV